MQMPSTRSTKSGAPKAWAAYVFVMTLGHSRHLFAQITFDQKVETWLQLHVNAYQFFGGVPRTLVPDNLKAAVIRAAYGVERRAVLNRSYRELARHYDFIIWGVALALDFAHRSPAF